MASILIRQIDDSVKAKLRRRASSHGRSMEMEAREILRAALSAEPVAKMNPADAIRRHILPLGGVDLAIPRREPLPAPVRFEK